MSVLLLALTDVTSLEDIGDSVEQQQHRRYIKTMKQELSLLLGRPLASQAIYSKYPTKTGRLVTPEQLRMIQAWFFSSFVTPNHAHVKG